jgi:hypothetical protein
MRAIRPSIWALRRGRIDAAIVADLRALAEAPEDVEQIAAGEGFWLGRVVFAHDTECGRGVPVRSVRTYLHGDMCCSVPSRSATEIE